MKKQVCPSKISDRSLRGFRKHQGKKSVENGIFNQGLYEKLRDFDGKQVGIHIINYLKQIIIPLLHQCKICFYKIKLRA